MATAVLERKRIPLNRDHSPFPTMFLVLDSNGAEVRGTYYRLLRPKETPEPVPADAWQAGVEAGWFSEKAKPAAWKRRAHRGRLCDVLRIVLDGSHHDWQTVEAYIRATPWGESLP